MHSKIISPQICTNIRHIQLQKNLIYTQNHILGYKYSFSVLPPHFNGFKIISLVYHEFIFVQFRVLCQRRKLQVAVA